MAFIDSGWDSGPTAGKGTPKMGRYKNTDDTLSTILGDTYFDDTIVALNATVGDFIFYVGSDGSSIMIVSTVTDNTDISTSALVLD